jgi:hypothetical protein
MCEKCEKHLREEAEVRLDVWEEVSTESIPKN